MLVVRHSSFTGKFGQSCISYFSRYLELPVIRFVAITFLIMAFINLAVACLTQKGGMTIYGSWTGGDYSTFYVAGTILNEYPPTRLYDFQLQGRLLHSLLPNIPGTAELPFINPPFFALIFQPLSLLSFIPSFLAWVVISICLYIAGLALIRKTLFYIPANNWFIIFLLAISFEPFIIECILGGNSSAFGFFAIALAYYFWRRGKLILSGIAFGLCLYKPTLLMLIIPMLVLARHFKILLGFLLSGATLAFISLLVLGKKPLVDYLQIMSGAAWMTTGSPDIFRNFKYVDILSFSRLLFGGFPPFIGIALIILAFISLYFLAKLWWELKYIDQNHSDLILACTLTWTAVFNFHFAIYDTILVVAASLLTANVLFQYSRGPSATLTPAFRFLLVLLYLTPWISQHLARLIGFQIFTVVLAVTGTYQLLTERHLRLNAKYHNISG